MLYNPDVNDDSYIGSADVLGLLPLYGQQFGIDSTLSCDYDGSEVDTWVSQVLDGSIIVDSLLVQYQVIDSLEVWTPGCPDPLWEQLILERSYVLQEFNVDNYSDGFAFEWHSDFLGYDRSWVMSFSELSGLYFFGLYDEEANQALLGTTSAFPMNQNGWSWTLPFPTEYVSFDSSGLNFTTWNGFLTSATYVNILPYWHYAE